MAFCPECGKAVTPDEAACSMCGKQLRSDGKKARAGRFHGTMMMTAPEAKEQRPANINAQLPTEHTALVASAAAMTSPGSGAPAAATRSSIPPSTNQSSNLATNIGAAALGRPGPSQAKATMLGAGAAKTAAQPEHRLATMIGAAFAPNTPRSKPPSTNPVARSSAPPHAKPSSSPPAQVQEIAKSERPPVVRQTIPQASANASVRTVQSMPVSPRAEVTEATMPSEALAPAAAPVLHDAKTVPSPLPPRTEPRPPNPARMVQAIPEVDATVVDASNLTNELSTVPRVYLPGDPVAPQLPAAPEGLRLRVHPFVSEHPEVAGGSNYVLLYWALCVVVVAAACALAFLF